MVLRDKAKKKPGETKMKVRKVRSDFGTRVARKIVCESCGAHDIIHFAPRKGQTVLCRACAAERFGAIDADAKIGTEERVLCERCQLYVHTACKVDDPLDCKEYARALGLRQSNRTQSAERTGSVLRVRRKSSPQESEP